MWALRNGTSRWRVRSSNMGPTCARDRRPGLPHCCSQCGRTIWIWCGSCWLMAPTSTRQQPMAPHRWFWPLSWVTCPWLSTYWTRGRTQMPMDAGFAPLHWASGAWESVMSLQYQHTALADQLFGLPRARKGSFVRTLLSDGANPNLRITKEPPRYGGTIMPRRLLIGGTPFFFAAMAGDVEVMRILLAAGADPTLATEPRSHPADGSGGAHSAGR